MQNTETIKTAIRTAVESGRKIDVSGGSGMGLIWKNEEAKYVAYDENENTQTACTSFDDAIDLLNNTYEIY